MGVLNKANAVAGAKYQPYLGQQLATVNQDVTSGWQASRDAAGAYQPYYAQADQQFQQAAGGNASAAAQPYMQQAGQTWGTNAMNQYMDPYQQGVVDRIGDLGARNLSEKLMPAIGDDFIRAGQYGSSRHMGEVGKALRDTQESVLAQQNQALSQGYTNAQTAFNNDANRQGNLAQMAGNFNSIDTNNALATGKAQGALGDAYQKAGLTGAAALDAVGKDEMGLQQKSLDLAKSQFDEQNNYGKTQVGFMSDVLRGVPNVGQTTTESKSAPLAGAQYQPSGIAQIAGGLSLASMLGKAKGGRIKAPALSYAKKGC